MLGHLLGRRNRKAGAIARRRRASLMSVEPLESRVCLNVSVPLNTETPTTIFVARSVGDSVAITAQETSTDPTDPTEGEPLTFASTAGFKQTVNFTTQTFTFTATAAGETLSAYVDGYDGDEQASATLAGTLAHVDINDTADTKDDITLFNPASSPQPYTQTINARVTNNGPAGTLQLAVTPAGSATLSMNSVILAAGASAEVTITPTAVSRAPNDVSVTATEQNAQIGAGSLTIVSVTMPPDIRNADTPAAMPDRIPPRANTPAHITVTPDLAGSGQSVTLAINGQNATNGSATIGGAATADITTTGDVNLSGTATAQTAPGGHAGNLVLVVRVRGQDTVSSQGFSVSSIPIKFKQTSGKDIGGGVLRFVYTWDSDSGQLADLNQVWIGEHVTYSDGGIHKGPHRPWREDSPDPTITPNRRPNSAGYPTAGTFTDTHYTFNPKAGPADSFTATQYYGFHDYRTDNRPADQSLGWQVNLTPAITISRFMENIGSDEHPTWQYRITKSGVTATAGFRGHGHHGGDRIMRTRPKATTMAPVNPHHGGVAWPGTKRAISSLLRRSGGLG